MGRHGRRLGHQPHHGPGPRPAHDQPRQRPPEPARARRLGPHPQRHAQGRAQGVFRVRKGRLAHVLHHHPRTQTPRGRARPPRPARLRAANPRPARRKGRRLQPPDQRPRRVPRPDGLHDGTHLPLGTKRHHAAPAEDGLQVRRQITAHLYENPQIQPPPPHRPQSFFRFATNFHYFSKISKPQTFRPPRSSLTSPTHNPQPTHTYDTPHLDLPPLSTPLHRPHHLGCADAAQKRPRLPCRQLP